MSTNPPQQDAWRNSSSPPSNHLFNYNGGLIPPIGRPSSRQVLRNSAPDGSLFSQLHHNYQQHNNSNHSHSNLPSFMDSNLLSAKMDFDGTSHSLGGAG